METPSRALAPSRLLLGVPSRAIIAWSSPAWSNTSRPCSAGARMSCTFAMALKTDLPRYRFGSPSRSSSASNWPVDAPDGTVPRPRRPFSNTTSVSMVGLPRESKTWQAEMEAIFISKSKLRQPVKPRIGDVAQGKILQGQLFLDKFADGLLPCRLQIFDGRFAVHACQHQHQQQPAHAQ